MRSSLASSGRALALIVILVGLLAEFAIAGLGGGPTPVPRFGGSRALTVEQPDERGNP